MKQLFTALLLLVAFVSISLAQTVTITPKKTVYTRKGKVSFKEKRTFTVTYPQISSAASPAMKKNLTEAISYWNVFGTTLRENQVDNDWLSEMSYEVKYNKNGVLDIALTQEGSAAYPDQSTIEIIADLKTGKQIKFADAFKTASLVKFAQLVNAKLETEKKDIVQRIDKGEFGEENGKEANDSLKEQISGLSFTAETFNEFSISDKGVTIIYDAGFPHVIQAAQPDGRYFFTWAAVKSFIKPDGLLGRFVR